MLQVSTELQLQRDTATDRQSYETKLGFRQLAQTCA